MIFLKQTLSSLFSLVGLLNSLKDETSRGNSELLVDAMLSTLADSSLKKISEDIDVVISDSASYSKYFEECAIPDCYITTIEQVKS